MARQAAVQQKVQRIANSVNRRRIQFHDQPADEENDGLLLKLAARIRTSLTTAPRRELQERIVVREEESFHEIAADISLEVAGVIREQSHLFPGSRVVAGSRRTYPLATVAPHIVGARTPAKDDDPNPHAKQSFDGSWKPRIGRFGVERKLRSSTDERAWPAANCSKSPDGDCGIRSGTRAGCWSRRLVDTERRSAKAR